MMKEFNIKFELPYIETNVFRQKHYNILLSLIGNSRLNSYMHYDGPGIITFDNEDVQHTNPTITLMEKYNRLKTNCLVYSLPENISNMNYYDKLFIYYSSGNKESYYGYVLYNTKNGKNTHKYFIDDDYNNLTQCLNKTFIQMYNTTLYDYYIKKNDALKCRKGLTRKDCPTITDHANMMNERKMRVYEFVKKNLTHFN